MEQNNKELEVTLNEQSLEILITKLIPTSQYFERSFEMLQKQMDEFRAGQQDLKADINRRFEQVDQGQKDLKADINRRFEQVDQGQKDLKADMDKRFEQVDKRFEQVDKRFEQVNQGQKDLKADMDKRFEQVNVKLDTILERMDTKMESGLRETRSLSIRLFSFAMVFSAISMTGLLAKITGLF